MVYLQNVGMFENVFWCQGVQVFVFVLVCVVDQYVYVFLVCGDFGDEGFYFFGVGDIDGMGDDGLGGCFQFLIGCDYGFFVMGVDGYLCVFGCEC